MKKLILSAAILVATISALVAQPRSNKPFQDDDRKIQNGIYSGKLTRAEAARLKAEQDRIDAMAYKFKRNDGYINQWERQVLNSMQKDLDKKIQKEKQDRNVGYIRRNQ